MKFDPALLRQLAQEDPDYAAKLARQYRKAMIVLARNDPSWFCQYVLRNEQDGSQIYQRKDHEEVQKLIVDNQRILLWTYPSWGKALPLGTEIPTPSGWVTMADLAVGDVVFSSDGFPCNVTAVTPVQTGRPVYEIAFDDGEVLRADADHVWLAQNRSDRMQGKPAHAISTLDFAEKLHADGGRLNWSIPLTGPVHYAPKALPVHPYVLGVWLGDGHSVGPTITFHESDRFVFDRCTKLDPDAYRIRPIPGREHLMRGTFCGPASDRRSPNRLSQRLKSLGVIRNKHIPAAYLQGSVEQREELLAGLLDTDGTVEPKSGRVEFCVTNRELAYGALELVRSLGFKARISSSPAKCYGRITSTRYRVRFTAHTPVFCLRRKRDAQVGATDRSGSTSNRFVRSVTLVQSEPVRCIQVDSPDHSYLAGRTYTVTHNCVVDATEILCADGTWVCPTGLTEWTKCLTWDPDHADLLPVTARATDNGCRPVIRITLADGKSETVTLEHPFMDSDLQWRTAESLRAGEKIMVLRHLEIPEAVCTPEAVIPDDEAEILGFLLAGRVDRRSGGVVLRNFKHAYWTQRRADLFAAAKWELRRGANQYAVVVKQVAGAMSPAEFLRSWVHLDRKGFPSAALPEVYRLRQHALRRLLSAYFCNAMMGLTVKRFINVSAFMGGTTGYGSNRAPKSMTCPVRGPLDIIQKLLLRAGAVAKVYKPCVTGSLAYVRNAYIGTLSGYASRYKPKDLRKPWSIALGWQQQRYFWCDGDSGLNYREPEMPANRMLAVPITSIERLPAEHTWSIEVKEAQHSFIANGGILNHNTNQISIGHVLWRIGKDPNCAIAILTNTGGMASRTVGALKTYIAESQEFRDVFPDVKPGEKWAESSFTVTRSTIRKDPTVQAVGLTGSIVGSRLDGLVIDDIDDMDSTHTAQARDQTEAKVRKQALTRLSAGGWAVAIGNVWHEDDCMHRLSKTGWVSRKYPLLDEFGQTRDPLNFPMERAYAIRDEDVGPLEFQRLYLLQARIDGEQRFRQEWIDIALERGRGMALLRDGLLKVPSGCRTITGVDLGVKQKSHNDPTAIITILEAPKGSGVEYQILHIVKGRWNAQEIMDNVAEQQRMFSSEVWVESNGAQDFLIQLMNMSGRGVPVRSFFTGRNKHDPMYGVESIAAEMATGRWIIPSPDGTVQGAEEEVDYLVQEMMAYTPNNHTGDTLMALWVARESARTSRGQAKGNVEFGRLRLRR